MKKTLYSLPVRAAAYILCAAAAAWTIFSAVNVIAVVSDSSDVSYHFEPSFAESRQLAGRLSEAADIIDTAMYKAARGTAPTMGDYSALERLSAQFYAIDNNTGTVMTNTSINDPLWYTEYTDMFSNGVPDTYTAAGACVTRYDLDTVVQSANKKFSHLNPYYERAAKTAETVDDTDPAFRIREDNTLVEVYPEDAVYDDLYSAGELYRFNSDGVLEPVKPQKPDEPKKVINTDYTAYIRIAPEALESALTRWNTSRMRVNADIRQMCCAAAVFVLALCLVTAVAGRKRDGSLKLYSGDKIWLEVCAGAVALDVIGVIAAGIAYAEFSGRFSQAGAPVSNNEIVLLLLAAAFAGSAFLIAVYASAVRSLKDHSFLKRSVCVRAVMFLWRCCKKGWRCVKKAGRAVISMSMNTRIILAVLAVYSVMIGIFSLIAGYMGFSGDVGIVLFMILLCAALLAAAGYMVYKNISGLDEVKKGIAIIRKGGAGYAIPECTGAAKEIAEGVNALGEGLEAAVKNSVKSERMKTELITNVSHDLKTPLTSIINYAELLSQMQLSPEEANDYAVIIKQKSARLKALTSDLFDISKAQSGNEELDMEKLDLKLLITQALGELSREIDGSGLDFRVSLPEDEAFITADGKKLSRVFENLISNAVKYSMKGTRVYVTLEKKDGVFVTELKNIASYPMNFSPDEITERFVRGDESRTGEGSGLGLAIAKSYTELMGGRFEVVTDGDLFKARISFKG